MTNEFNDAFTRAQALQRRFNPAYMNSFSIAIKYDSLFFGRLKIPSYGINGKMVDIYEDKRNFERLSIEFDDYFSNKFS